MKKHKKNNFDLNLSVAIILAVSFSIYLIFPQIFGSKAKNPVLLSQSFSDVTELPKDIEQSIKNLKPQRYVKVPILMYHYVEYVKDEGDTIRKSLNIIPYILEQQVKTLKEAGFVFITTSDLADYLDKGKKLPVKSIILTFDDGYRSFYTDVLPILKKYQVKAVVYVVPSFVNKPNNMDLWQLKEISGSGLVEIGAHTVNHAYLPGLPLKTVKFEIEESKKFLENSIGINVSSFAYPYGAFDNQTIDIVEKTGFTSAVTTIDGIYAQDINRFFLYRIRPGVKTGEELLKFFESFK